MAPTSVAAAISPDGTPPNSRASMAADHAQPGGGVEHHGHALAADRRGEAEEVVEQRLAGREHVEDGRPGVVEADPRIVAVQEAERLRPLHEERVRGEVAPLVVHGGDVRPGDEQQQRGRPEEDPQGPRPHARGVAALAGRGARCRRTHFDPHHPHHVPGQTAIGRIRRVDRGCSPGAGGLGPRHPSDGLGCTRPCPPLTESRPRGRRSSAARGRSRGRTPGSPPGRRRRYTPRPCRA